mgnify:CR=1 FL=1
MKTPPTNPAGRVSGPAVTKGWTVLPARAINADDPAARVTDIGSSLDLLVSCEPVKTVRGSGDDADNIDYIRASTVPYTIYSRKSPRGSLHARPPELDDSVCDDE